MNDAMLTKRPNDPLSTAVMDRDRNVIDMVTEALELKNVVLAYQPVVAANRMNRPAFFEGLIRVLDKTGRPIPAREFITQIDDHPLGRKVDALALELGLRALAENPSLRLSINLSARSIGYTPWLRALDEGLRDDRFIGERLILEITESSALLIPDVVRAFMDELQDKGISFALDDFGAGYSSFRYLRDLYFDIIKIDGQFIRGIHQDPDNQVLTKAMVSIGRHFDMMTVAETVETVEEAQYLAGIGVDCLQGYYLGAPSLKPVWTTGAGKRKAS